MEDYIIRGMAANHQVRFFAAYSKNLVEEARKHHDTSPVATAALGRLLTAVAMMGTMCKNDSDVITIQIKCSGPIGGLVVTADANQSCFGTDEVCNGGNRFICLCDLNNTVLDTPYKTIGCTNLVQHILCKPNIAVTFQSFKGCSL